MILGHRRVFLECLEFHGLSNVCNISKNFFSKRRRYLEKWYFATFSLVLGLVVGFETLFHRSRAPASIACLGFEFGCRVAEKEALQKNLKQIPDPPLDFTQFNSKLHMIIELP